MSPFIDDFPVLINALLGPFRLPRHPIALGRFGLSGLRSARGLVQSRFEGERAPALFAGMAAHSMLELDQVGTAAFGLLLSLFGHVVNWPIPRTGSQAIVDALAAHLRALGGEIQVRSPVKSIAEHPDERAILFDVTPRQMVEIAGDQISGRYRRQLEHFRRGVGVLKVDWALDGPVPWTAEACHRAGTIHLGGTFAEIASAEAEVQRGGHPTMPFVLVAQPSRFDPTRAPERKHTLWAYCHVPNGSTQDQTGAIEAQIERFAPGFRDCILARICTGPAELEARNPNYLGGDINGGAQDIRQLFTRPAVRYDPYSTPNERLFICSSSTPPGGGVHGMCGFHAAESVIKRQTGSS